eukprot:TRINITY_DN4284_c0_g1_i1.p4 TRINITY_DN4284_c0_g1~~TRINITY_DN4284_c0_g1_i1.p4  ORF type:complete len:62 (+),score=20.20 TRINITY_DN4284_c0_g1_i1:500-685(+)
MWSAAAASAALQPLFRIISFFVRQSYQMFEDHKKIQPLVSLPHVLCVDTGRSSETAKAHRG